MTAVFRKLRHGLRRGNDVLVGGEWYPVIGYAGVSHPDGTSTGSIFTDKPIGKHEAWLGYRIDMSDVEDCREGSADD